MTWKRELHLILKEKTLRISDRREAIKTAVMLANPGDVILVAGKGHETYQEIMGVKHHFDDKEELENALLLKLNEIINALLSVYIS